MPDPTSRPLRRAVELTRLVVAANASAATGRTVSYGVSPEGPTCRTDRGDTVGMIRIGLIGGGGIVDAHIRGYCACADTLLPAAVADVVPEVASRRAAELDCAAYTDYREMIGSAELDAVGHTEREGIAVLQMILAGYESARTRTVVRVGGGVS